MAGGRQPLQIGSGINTGSLMLGVVGGTARLETTVISDAVNLSARLESMTRFYDVPLLISEHTRRKIGESEFTEYIRRIDRVVPKGKRTEVEVYEVFAGDPVAVRDAKVQYEREFQRACAVLDGGKSEKAEALFRELLARNPDDRVIECYLQRCAGAPPPGETFRGPALESWDSKGRPPHSSSSSDSS